MATAALESKMAEVQRLAPLAVRSQIIFHLLTIPGALVSPAGDHQPNSSRQQQQHGVPLLCHIWQDHDQDHVAGCRRWQGHGRGSSTRQAALPAHSDVGLMHGSCWQLWSKLANAGRTQLSWKLTLIRLHCCCCQVGQTLRVGGWVKTGREAGAGAWAFLEVNDGSCFDSLQVRRSTQHTAPPTHTHTGSSSCRHACHKAASAVLATSASLSHGTSLAQVRLMDFFAPSQAGLPRRQQQQEDDNTQLSIMSCTRHCQCRLWLVCSHIPPPHPAPQHTHTNTHPAPCVLHTTHTPRSWSPRMLLRQWGGLRSWCPQAHAC